MTNSPPLTIVMSRRKITVHTVPCIYCTERKKVIQECINPIAKGDFKWIYACCWNVVNSNEEKGNDKEEYMRRADRENDSDVSG